MKRSFRVTLRGAGPRKAFPYAEIPFDSVAVFGTRHIGAMNAVS